MARASSIDRLLLWTERLLVGTGVAILAWVAAFLADGMVAQWMAREALARLPHSVVSTTSTPGGPVDEPADPTGSAAITTRPLVLARGAPIGELSIPRVHLSAVVLHGSDTRTLRRGPGHIESTALPGQGGNMAVAGHRDSFFRPIRNVRVGDDVFLDTAEGRYRYRISSLDVVGPEDVDVLKATAAPTLTLITCYPFWLAGAAPNRFIVRAVEVARPDGTTSEVARSLVSGTTGTWAETMSGRPAAVGQAILEEPTRSTGSTVSARSPLSPDAAVRDAIERFRLTYNARLVRRPADATARPLYLGRCDVEFSGSGTSATGRCGEPNDGGNWIFSLRAVESGWTIVAVEPQ